MGLQPTLVRMQLRLPLRERGFGLNATDVVLDSSPVENERSLSLHTASFLAAALFFSPLLAASPCAHRPLRSA
jgi:hypothetical protein